MTMQAHSRQLDNALISNILIDYCPMDVRWMNCSISNDGMICTCQPISLRNHPIHITRDLHVWHDLSTGYFCRRYISATIMTRKSYQTVSPKACRTDVITFHLWHSIVAQWNFFLFIYLSQRNQSRKFN